MFFFALPIMAQNESTALTLDYSMREALAINPDLLNANQSVVLAKEKIVEARTLYMPVFSANLNASMLRNYHTTIVNNEGGGSVVLPASEEEPYYNIRISALQNIYSGGRTANINKLAKRNLNKAEIEANIIKNKIMHDVKIAFNNTLYYKELGAYYDAQQQKKYTQDTRRKSGLAYLNYQKNLLDLLSVIGYELNSPVGISGDFTPIVKMLDLQACIVLAFQYNPQLRIAQYEQDMDMLNVWLAMSQKLPYISVSAGQEWDGADSIVEDIRSWYVSLNVNLPLFDGGAWFSRIRQNNIATRTLTIRQSKVEDSIRLNIYKAYLDYSYYRTMVLESNLHKKTAGFTDTELEIIKNLNDAYYELEYAVGVPLDQY
jgi:outer membrane protein TolC